MLRRSREHRGTQHVGVVDRALYVSEVADTAATSCFFPRQVHNPAAGAVRDVQPPLRAGLFVGLQESEPNQRSPDDDGIIFCVTASATREIKAIAPAVLLELRSFVTVEPVKAGFGFSKKLGIPGRP